MAETEPLIPLETLFAERLGPDLPLPSALAEVYGVLSFPDKARESYVISNFVSTLDGVVSLGIPGHSGGGEISGFNAYDQLVMGLLRALADAVIVTAGSLRASPKHLWTPEFIYPPFRSAYLSLRAALGKAEPAATLIVTARGELEPDLPVFQAAAGPIGVLTTQAGAQQIRRRPLPTAVRVEVVKAAGRLFAAEIVAAARQVSAGRFLLVEGGPHLVGAFFAERQLDELFLTLSPQVAGRDELLLRPGLVSGQALAPDNPVWGRLYSVKRAENHLFLRYGFPA